MTSAINSRPHGTITRLHQALPRLRNPPTFPRRVHAPPPQELLALMRGKASKEDLRTVLARSVELALDAHRRAAGEVMGTGATRFRWAGWMLTRALLRVRVRCLRRRRFPWSAPHWEWCCIA